MSTTYQILFRLGAARGLQTDKTVPQFIRASGQGSRVRVGTERDVPENDQHGWQDQNTCQE